MNKKQKLTLRKLALIRRASTASQNKYGISSSLKSRFKPRTITLPKLKCLELP
jgi:hypothetical protein